MSTTHFTRTWQDVFTCTSETFDGPRQAARVAGSWRRAGWAVRIAPGTAPKPYCGQRRCSILTEHDHGQR